MASKNDVDRAEASEIDAFEFTDAAFTVATSIIITTSVLSAILHIMFMKAIRKHCGWKTNFAFTILFSMSLNGLMYFTIELIATIMAVAKIDRQQHFVLLRVTGTLMICPFFMTAPLHILLALHRFVFTLFPVSARSLVTKRLSMMCLGVLAAYCIFFATITMSSLMGCVYDPSYLATTPLDLPYSYILVLLNQLNNYIGVFLHVVVYSIIFAVLIFKGNIDLRDNNNLRMTAQASIMVVIEMFFFIYWTFCTRNPGPVAATVDELSNLLYFDAIILPYIFLNRNIRARFGIKWASRARTEGTAVRSSPKTVLVTAVCNMSPIGSRSAA
ncbi:hypothetical protein Q1695_003294 [Nippostrongylus brasiliensis]|nr:hypothetical protein Q1695_003294 [Nippostrongylus brasiliensis]